MRTFPGTFFISHHPSSTYPIVPGDIEVFKDMQLTSLNLYYCNKLTGVFGRGQGMVYRWGQDQKQVLPQAIAHDVHGTWMLAANVHPTVLTTYVTGDIESLKDCPLQVLNLAGIHGSTTNFTGKYNEVGRVLPQGIAQRMFQDLSPLSRLPYTSLISTPRQY